MMAISINPQDSRLRITYSLGIDEGTGKEITKSKSYSNIKHDATDEAIFTVATALIGLQKYPALNIERLDEKEIVEVVE